MSHKLRDDSLVDPTAERHHDRFERCVVGDPHPIDFHRPDTETLLERVDRLSPAMDDDDILWEPTYGRGYLTQEPGSIELIASQLDHTHERILRLITTTLGFLPGR